MNRAWFRAWPETTEKIQNMYRGTTTGVVLEGGDVTWAEKQKKYKIHLQEQPGGRGGIILEGGGGATWLETTEKIPRYIYRNKPQG